MHKPYWDPDSNKSEKKKNNEICDTIGNSNTDWILEIKNC